MRRQGSEKRGRRGEPSKGLCVTYAGHSFPRGCLFLWDILRETMWSYCISEWSTGWKREKISFASSCLLLVKGYLHGTSLSCAAWLHGWWLSRSVQISHVIGSRETLGWELRGTQHRHKVRCWGAGPSTAWRTRGSHGGWAVQAIPASQQGLCVHLGWRPESGIAASQ